ncbi:MAG: 1-deoxy-D-xylulose-5-phosphate synthase [Actinomycetia bacterium]|nr:1-deoxy-D-xylulose-5-phosphate synthase [Actinomycetes bacterium]MCH9788354.1 1-deoxy-D-xylulose-5-phosphate synthase [Actinomycetes bacterium]
MNHTYRLLQRIQSPHDVRALTPAEVPALAEEIRSFLVEKVAATGGHLGPNLGVVELSIALHRVFYSPDDAIIWDTGHQAYVHKILTGRGPEFDSLRREGGLSGYPSRQESPHDIVENSHASTAISYADGLAKAWERRGLLGSRHVIAVIGDGALTGGMAWEALNNIAASNRPVVIVVNDNERSYSPTIGGLAHHLATLRTTRNYERFMTWGKVFLQRTPFVGRPLYDALHGVKKGVKDVVAPQGLFEDLGLKYIGPVDGHDEQELEFALGRARDFQQPVIVHAITTKGRGYAPAENDEADRFHGVGVIDPDTGQPLTQSGPTWTSIFADEMLQIGRDETDVVAITAAMLGPTGLERFAASYPDRTYDVGIAEQHAATSAAGLAFGGLHPVVAVYATFLNRAFDQVVMDCALHNAGVTFVLDRAGVTGDDGPSHNGVWDMAMLSVVPGLHLAAPRDESTLRRALRESVVISDAPSVVRFPKGALGPDIPSVRAQGGVDVLFEHDQDEVDVLIVAIGSFCAVALDVGSRLRDQGITTRVVDPRWALPVNEELVEMSRQGRRVVVIEDGVRVGGIGAGVSQAMQDAHVVTPTRIFGIPRTFLPHGKRQQILEHIGLTSQQISRDIVEWVAAGPSGLPTSEETQRPVPRTAGP